MENKKPGVILGAFSVFIVSLILLTVPLYFLWNWAAPIYLSFLPAIWQNIPYLHIVGLVGLVMALRTVFFFRVDTESFKKRTK